jgi:hypothetical protein
VFYIFFLEMPLKVETLYVCFAMMMRIIVIDYRLLVVVEEAGLVRRILL